MRQLSGADSYHLLEESPRQHMHTIKIAVVDPAAAAEPIDFARVREWAAQRFPSIPPLSWRVVPVPWGLGRPYIVEVPELDVDAHLVPAVLPAPTAEAFDELVSEIASEALPRDRPLWELWFVEGLTGGRVGFVLKIHHAVADGGATVRLLEAMFDPAPDATPGPPPTDPLPTALAIARRALRAQVRQWRQFPRQARRQLAALRGGRERKQAGGTAVTKPFTPPLTRFNRPLTPSRLYVDVTVPLADLKAIKDSSGATLNDVYVALCGGALRRYLARHGELPDTSLTAAVPVSLRRPDELDQYGNRISYWYATVASHLADPVERVAAVKEGNHAAREFAESDRDLFSDWADYYTLYRAFVITLMHAVERLSRRASFTCVVSNVRGPHPLSFGGAPVVAVRSMGPIVGTQGLNLTAWSYGDDLAIGLHACREHVPDLRDLGYDLRAELAAMKVRAASSRAVA